MRTARVLTVSPSTWSRGGYLVPGVYLVGGSTWSGVYLVQGGVPGLGGVNGPGGCTWLGGVPGRGVYLVRGVCVPGPGVVYLVWGGVRYSPPVNRMTNRCKSITWPQTSFAGGKNEYIYHPQTRLWKGNVFTPVCQSFCSQGGVCLSACWDTHTHTHTHTPPGRHPPGRHPLGRQPWADIPLGRHPPAQCMLGYTHTPPSLPSACWDRHGYCCGRYASYWNAFLFNVHSLS